MSDNIAVKVEHVSKHFRLPTESSSSLRTTMVNYFKGIKGYREQQVLKDISFEVEKGDFFGIVGRNGSGKSTLLKIISQIYVPEKGSVTIDGKLVSFIELGVGFNPELTGRENVYLNGALLGFSTEEINEMYDDIVEFAELSEFMNQKLKNYSSGMQVRLAFSVAIQAKSDILVLDEILAVGDEAFQRKSREFFEEIRQDKSKTVILVTHDMSAVQRYCNKVIYIKDGKLEKSENLQEITNQYSEDNLESRSTHPRKKVEEKTRIWLEAKSNQVLSDSTDTFDFLVHIENNDERYQKEQLY
ncbi:MAG: ABC transporter ATP-binding protein, partial [Lactococcus raffinolactis]|nr:ABC transporter ATP-binding protein [Lactococcus raffinolactis]